MSDDDTTPNDEFVGLLDEQARALLLRLKNEASLEDEEKRLSVMDHVRGFSAVTSYVETRLKIAPQKAAKSKIEEMRERLSEPPRRRAPRANGRAPGGGGSPAAAEIAPEADAPPPI